MKRKAFDLIKNHVKEKEFTIITGARQIGKTTLIKQIFEEIGGEFSVYINLERKSILDDLNQNPENIFKYFTNNNKTRLTAFIDEIQYLDDPSNFLKLLYDDHADKIKIVATGSSAFYIDKSFKDSLAGRKKIFELKTLDFEEFLIFKNENNILKDLQNIRAGNLEKSLFEAQIWILMEEYATFGGYPAVILDNNVASKKERLYEIRDSFLKRDIQDAGVINEDKFYKLCMLLSSQIGNLLNINELSNTLNISNATVENYLYVLQKCFHITLLKPFYNNLRKELVKMPKIYFNDLGLRNVMLEGFNSIDTRIDKGAVLENLVFRRLSEIYRPNQIKFWRTTEGNEVDFVIEEVLNIGRGIEIKFSNSEIKPNKYKIFSETYPTFPLEFVTWRGKSLLL